MISEEAAPNMMVVAFGAGHSMSTFRTPSVNTAIPVVKRALLARLVWNGSPPVTLLTPCVQPVVRWLCLTLSTVRSFERADRTHILRSEVQA